MKPWLSILISAAVSVGTVAVYDQIRQPDRPDVIRDAASIEPDQATTATDPVDEGPTLAGRSYDIRLELIERRLLALESEPKSREASPVRKAMIADPVAEVEHQGSEEGPTTEAVKRFRELREAATSEDRRKYREKRVNGALNELDLRLSDRQREKVVEALAAFEPRWRQVWSDAKTQGAAQGESVDWQQVIADTNATVTGEFAEILAEFIPHPADAEQLATFLTSSGDK